MPFVASSRHRPAGPGVSGWGPGLRGGVQCRAKPEAGYELSLKERQNKPPAPCSVLFWPVLEHPQNKRVLFCSATRLHRGGPGEPGGRRGRGWARKRGPLGARPPSPGPRGSTEACGGGSSKNQRSLRQNLLCWRSEPRDLRAQCTVSAQTALTHFIVPSQAGPTDLVRA